MLLPLFTSRWPFLPQTCTGSNSAQKQTRLVSWPIEAIAEINVWSDFCCGRQLVATYFYVSQEEGGAGPVSWGTLSGSDGAGLSGEEARGSWLTPSACGSHQPPAMLPRTRTSHTSVGVGHAVPLPPSHPSATSSKSPTKMSSWRPVSPGLPGTLPRVAAQPGCGYSVSFVPGGMFPSRSVAVLRGGPVFWLTAPWGTEGTFPPSRTERKGGCTAQPRRDGQSRREKAFPGLRHIKFRLGRR